MMTWTVIGTGIDGDGTGKSFSIDLDTNADTWRALGASPKLFFAALSGKSAFVGISERGLQLVYKDAAGKDIEAAFFHNFVANSQPGATGSGRSAQGLNFNWKLDSL